MYCSMWHFMMQCIQLLSHMSHMNLTGEAERRRNEEEERANRKKKAARTIAGSKRIKHLVDKIWNSLAKHYLFFVQMTLQL